MKNYNFGKGLPVLLGQIQGPGQPERVTGQPPFILAIPDRATKFEAVHSSNARPCNYIQAMPGQTTKFDAVHSSNARPGNYIQAMPGRATKFDAVHSSNARPSN
jgi:hypothetical protein